jgi:hypothetical protein
MEALRDGLIQCLSLVFNELTSRPIDTQSQFQSQAPGSSGVQTEDPTDRMMRIQAQAQQAQQTQSNPAAAGAGATIEQEAKLALGLLVSQQSAASMRDYRDRPRPPSTH